MVGFFRINKIMSTLLESKRSSFVIDQAAYAVADAMMVAQAELLLEPLSSWHDFYDEEELGIFVDLRTDGHCRKSSYYAIDYIIENHKSLFRSASILEAYREVKVLKRSDWPFHTYFLLQDAKNTWYAGSPANYIVKEPENNQRLTRVISSPDLVEVISRIEDVEGGLWPSVDLITRTIDKSKYKGLNSEYALKIVNLGQK